jgi:hypothetical protein
MRQSDGHRRLGQPDRRAKQHSSFEHLFGNIVVVVVSGKKMSKKILLAFLLLTVVSLSLAAPSTKKKSTHPGHFC